MASTLQIASGGRLILGIGIGGAPEGARRLRHRLPGGARAGRPARGGGRRHPRAVDRRAGDPAVAVLPAGRGVRPPGAGPAAADHHRWRDARPGPGWPPGSAMAGARSTTTSRRTCRSTSRRSRRPAGDARTSTSRRLPGRLADATSRSSGTPVGRRRRARPGSAGRRPVPTAPSSWPARPPTSTRSWRPPDRW